VVILDLEDGVAATDRAVARDALTAVRLDPTGTVVRINSAGSPDQTLDLVALARTGYDMVMLATPNLRGRRRPCARGGWSPCARHRPVCWQHGRSPPSKWSTP
jgi:hypothetical protein